MSTSDDLVYKMAILASRTMGPQRKKHTGNLARGLCSQFNQNSFEVPHFQQRKLTIIVYTNKYGASRRFVKTKQKPSLYRRFSSGDLRMSFECLTHGANQTIICKRLLTEGGQTLLRRASTRHSCFLLLVYRRRIIVRFGILCRLRRIPTNHFNQNDR